MDDRSALWRFLSTRSAGVALMFALSVIPIIGMIGLAIDLSFVTLAKAQLNSAADAAALAAVRIAADAFSAGRRNYIELGQTAGLQWFNSQDATILEVHVDAPEIKVTRSGGVFSSSIFYQATVPTAFADFFGLKVVPIGGTSSATITTSAYVAVTLLMDNSSSMLMPAKQAGVDLMNVITPAQSGTLAVPSGLGGLPCAFACHWDPGGRDYFGVARANKIQLRFDVARSALQSAIEEMINEEMVTDQFALGVFTFGDVLTQAYPLETGRSSSTNLISGLVAVQAIQTPVVLYTANTNFPGVMASLATMNTVAGNGSSPANPRKALIIVTDGVADFGSRKIPTSRGPFVATNCAAMKSLGFDVYVLYTPYIATPPSLLLPFDNGGLLPYLDNKGGASVAAELESCASVPANYMSASDALGIATTIKQLLQAALGNAGRFTD